MKANPIPSALFLTAIAFTLFHANSARAALFVYEPFSYTAGSNNIAGLNGGTGFSAAWTGAGSVTSPGATYPNLPTTGLGLAVNGQEAYRNLTSSPETAGSTIYISFIGQSTGSAYAGLSLYNATSETLYLGRIGSNWGIDNKNGGGGATSASTTAVSTQSLLVYRIDFLATSATISLYVNPTLGMPEPAVASATVTKGTALVYDRIRLGAGGAATTLDEVRFGTTFADVAPIPEPSGLVLGLLGAGGLLTIRRRNGN